MMYPGRQLRRVWTIRLALLALLVQLVGGGHPMAAPAGDARLPAWLAGSICSSGDEAPAVPDDGSCTDCLLLCQGTGALPAIPAGLAPPPPAGLPVALRDTPATRKAALLRLAARGPPLA